MFTDNEMQQLVAVVDEFKPEREPCVFMADVTTKIERHDLSPKDKIDTVAVFKVPHHLHPDQYGQKLKALVHRAVALPSGQTAFLKLTVWGQNSNGNPHIKAWGVSPPEGIFVLRAECKNLETFMDVVNDPGFQQILAEVKKELDFHVKGAWFCTDVVTRLERS
ncbi:hypothetical protein B0H11DRAFT_1311181 [Mycena galericulata]|nr:hypothetical protein B0H11DRAFT_1311181 [Mycena galericulata]